MAALGPPPSPHPPWWDAAPREPAVGTVWRRSGSGTVRCDVAVVGAGLTGASAAIALARSGLRVIVVDRGDPATAATAAGTGIILTGLGEHYARTVARIGRRAARAVWSWTVANRRRVARLVARHRIPCGYARTGSCALAEAPEERSVLLRSHALLLEDRFKSSLIDVEGLRMRLGATGFLAGTFHRDDAVIDTLAFARGLLDASRSLGVEVADRTRVHRLVRDGEGWLLQAGRSAIHARQVLVAANAAASGILPELRHITHPLRERAIAVRPLGRSSLPSPAIARWGAVYWRTWRDHVIIGGMDRRRLLAYLRRRLRLVRRFALTHAWSGRITGTADGFPLIGPLPRRPGVWTCLGYRGTGFGYATLGAAAVAAGMIGEPPPADIPERFHPGRFPALHRRG